MDIRKIRKLIELINETGVGEIEVKSGEESVRISRQGTVPLTCPPSVVVQQAPSAPVTEMRQLAAPLQETAAKSSLPEGYVLKSPMVGTVYLAPTPGAKPFAEVGKRVSVGDTLCLIEAMKMFNKIEADKSGVLSARMIENEQPVEYEQPLFIITEE